LTALSGGTKFSQTIVHRTAKVKARPLSSGIEVLSTGLQPID
jgi:hypothetical protein